MNYSSELLLLFSSGILKLQLLARDLTSSFALLPSTFHPVVAIVAGS